MTILLASLLTLAAAAQDAPRTGTFTDQYEEPDTKKLIMRYRMTAPEKLPERRTLGLIVHFHGMNGNENNCHRGVVDSLKRLGILDQYVVMGGKSRGAGWATQDDPFVLTWIDWAKKTYPVDERRVSLVGTSNGGWMVKRFSWQHQELFAGVVAYYGGGREFRDEPRDPNLPPPPPPPRGAPADVRLEYYIVHGDEDDQVDVKTSRDCTADLRRKGYRYVYRELDGKNHGTAWPVDEVRDDALAFLHALRNKEMPLREEDKQLLSKVRIKPDLFGDAATLAEVKRIGGAYATKSLAKAFSSRDEKIRTAAVGTCLDTLYGREMVLRVVKLTRDRSPAVKEAAYRALSTMANWRCEAAQQFLCLQVRKKSLKVEERRQAAKALSDSARLQMWGNFEDAHVVWTLVGLLEDDDAMVRATAHSCLSRAVQDGFDFDPAREPSEQKDALAKAKSWCEKECGPLTPSRRR